MTSAQTQAAVPAAAPSGVSLRASVVVLVLLWVLIYLPGLFRPGLLDDADSVHAEAAREMVVSGDWVTLHANGIRYLEKAPLMYWAVAASFKTFGVHDWSARLPVALGILALILAALAIGRRSYGDYGGFACGLVMATVAGPFIFTRFLIPDMLVALWLTLTMGCFLASLEGERPSRWASWGMAAGCAVNVLTKGLIGVVFPLGIIGLYLLLTGRLNRLLRMYPLSSTAIFFFIATPWHLLAGRANPDMGSVRGFYWFYFVNEHLLRYLNKRVPRDYDTVPLALFWGLLLVWLLPWSTYLVPALREVPLRFADLRGRLATSARARANLLCAIWALVVLVFFSFSTRQEYYVLPALPALALLIGGWLERESAAELHTPIRRWGRRAAWALAAIAMPAGAVASLLAFTAHLPAGGSDLASVLRSNPQAYALSFGHIQDLTGPAMVFFRLPLLLFGTSLIAGSVANLWLRGRGRARIANLALAAMMVPLIWAAQLGFVTFSPVLSSKELAEAIAREGLKPEDIVEINGEYESGSTLNYYLEHPVRILNGRSANLWYGSFFPDAPQIFDDDQSFPAVWDGPRRVFLFSEEGKLPAAAQSGRIVGKSGGKVVVANR